ncbi:MAG: hypothetical protein JOZ22_19910 [Acidobacteriia bacterium]|nr:hypothetical protein [Terriglobia bacterium]
MSLALLSVFAAPFAAVSVRPPKVHLATGAVEDLFQRLRQRLYPETLPVLASYWLKTVYRAGNDLGCWRQTQESLRRAADQEFSGDEPSRAVLLELQCYIQDSILTPSQATPGARLQAEAVHARLDPDSFAAYFTRLLNEWLPVEVARLLTNESESGVWQEEDGIPVLATARALERLLVRERLSPATLEMLLRPALCSSRAIYPADAEILRDVVLALLGRTAAPDTAVLPALLLGAAPYSHLPTNFHEAVSHARIVRRPGGNELYVPLALSDVQEILRTDQVQIGSILVTSDGRWWESEKLLYGENYGVVYLPKGRLRIDYSADHARLRVPWPEMRRRWNGPVSFPKTFELFGREWRVKRWETETQLTWLDLEFFRVLPSAAGPVARYAA